MRYTSICDMQYDWWACDDDELHPPSLLLTLDGTETISPGAEHLF